MLTTSLRLLRQHDACEERYRHLKGELGPKWGDSKPIPLAKIIETNGIDDALWALRATPKKQDKHRNRIAHTFACDCAEHALKRNKSKEIETDPRSWKAIEVKRLWLEGKATDEELDAAWRAARSAAGRAAESAAWSAAWSAAESAAESAAWRAAWRAAGSAERKWQAKHFLELLEEDDDG